MRRFFVLKPIVLGATIFLLFSVGIHERRLTDFGDCWTCGWQTRQAFFLFGAAALVVVLRWWTALLSLVASLKVIISVTVVTLWVWGYLPELERPWPPVISSCGTFYEAHPEFLFEVGIALFLTWVSARYLCRFLANHFR